MSLRFVFLLITQVASWLRLSRRKEAWKTAEILILRHQLTVLQRHQACRPKLTWADRALLATLASVIPRARRRDCGCWSPPTRSCAGTETSSAAADVQYRQMLARDDPCGSMPHAPRPQRRSDHGQKILKPCGIT
jgi:hypothetical protein